MQSGFRGSDLPRDRTSTGVEEARPDLPKRPRGVSRTSDRSQLLVEKRVVCGRDTPLISLVRRWPKALGAAKVAGTRSPMRIAPLLPRKQGVAAASEVFGIERIDFEEAVVREACRGWWQCRPSAHPLT